MTRLTKYLSQIFVFPLLLLCSNDSAIQPIDVDYRSEMRSFVRELSTYSKPLKSDFLIIPQNGQEHITDIGEKNDIAKAEYLNAIEYFEEKRN